MKRLAGLLLQTFGRRWRQRLAGGGSRCYSAAFHLADRLTACFIPAAGEGGAAGEGAGGGGGAGGGAAPEQGHLPGVSVWVLMRVYSIDLDWIHVACPIAQSGVVWHGTQAQRSFAWRLACWA